MLWGIDCYKTAPGFAIARAFNDLNGALQMMWNQARESSYWTNDTVTLKLLQGETSIDLDDDIQNVVGPCRREDTKRQLTRLGTIGELETFEDIFTDGQSALEPLAYHVERLEQPGGDPAKCVLHVVPEVQEASIDFLLEVVREAPRYTADDLAACPVIPIPHRYIETLLLPIVRYRASGFTMLFRDKDRQDVIDREYHEARVALGLADPLPGKANTPERETTKK